MRREFPYKHLFEDYLQAVRNYSQHTSQAYLRDVNQFFTFSKRGEQDIDPSTINSKSIRSWVRELAKNQISPKSIHRKVSAIRNYLKALSKQGIQDPISLEVQLPKIKKTIPSYVKVSDMNQLLNTMEAEAEDYQSYRDMTIISTFYHLGVRRAELIGLKLADVDYSKGEIKVIGKGNKERLIPFTKELEQQLKRLLTYKEHNNIPGAFLFSKKDGNALSERWVYSMINKALGNTYADKKSPHVLRHSFATHLLQNGADINAIKELLGHSSLSATQLYAHNDIKQLKKVYKQTHPFS